MPDIKSFADVQDVLRPLYDNQRTAYNLDNMHRLMDCLGNPQAKLKVVHVAGTSGKTSTCYYIAGLLHEAGYNVGLTISPHVDEINERVQIGGLPLPEATFCKEFAQFYELLEASGVAASYFECAVAFAFWEFDRQAVDYAVVEVGLGGLLDATNVVSLPDKLCVITDIGLDHTEILGDTLGKIAAQKAGIVQQSNDIFMYRQDDEVMDAVAARVQSKQGKLHLVPVMKMALGDSSLPQFQQRNLWLAGYVANFILEQQGRTLTTVMIDTVARSQVPARMETIRYKGKSVIIDGSHNAQKLQALFDSIKAKYPKGSIAAAVGFIEGDRARLQGAVEVVGRETARVIVTSFSGEEDYPKKSVSPAEVVAAAQNYGYDHFRVIENPITAVESLLKCPEDILLITGSFYLLNHIRPHLKKP